jgi:hypothetical protein
MAHASLSSIAQRCCALPNLINPFMIHLPLVLGLLWLLGATLTYHAPYRI